MSLWARGTKERPRLGDLPEQQETAAIFGTLSNHAAGNGADGPGD